MKSSMRSSEQGIALIIVMIVIVVLGILAGGFAYSMKVETKLARNTSFEPDLEWLGRSGVEMARYILGQQMAIPGQGAYDALNQKWAGGLGETNDEVLAGISLEDNQLGIGSFSLKIIDLERKFNINTANEQVLQTALALLSVDASEFSTIIDSILDWREFGDNPPRLNGAKDKYYLNLDPKRPYYAKNGPIDDLSELLSIRGITPEIYWGPAGTNSTGQTLPSVISPNLGHTMATVSPVGLVDLFTPISAGLVNPNTASLEVLQLVGFDPDLAQAIIDNRRGLDGVDGTEDDTPYLSPREVPLPVLSQQAAANLSRVFTTRSYTFEIQVDARIGQNNRRFVALVRRNSRQDIPVLYFHWQ